MPLREPKSLNRRPGVIPPVERADFALVAERLPAYGPTTSSNQSVVMKCASFCVAGLVVLAGALSAFAAGDKAADKPIPPKPPLPAIKALSLNPSNLTLSDARDTRKVLVLGEREDGGVIDLTAEAKLSADSAAVAVDS